MSKKKHPTLAGGELGLEFEEDDIPTTVKEDFGTREREWDGKTETEEMKRCFAHDHNDTTGELLWKCPEPGTWVARLKAGNVYLCDDHLRARGNADEMYVRVDP